jgi:hypothetical protein
MSKLYATETGRVVRAVGEELTTFRHARKVLELPATSQAAHLHVLARPHAPDPGPLHITVNGHATSVNPTTAGTWHWLDLSISPDQLVAGENILELWTDATAMTGWALAMEPGHAEPASFISDDVGQQWRNEQMGYLNANRGEYVVRVRLAEGNDPPPPALVHEDLSHPKVEALRAKLPAAALGGAPLYDRVRAISAWIAGSFEHRNSNRASLYAPWDAETILAWGAFEIGHAGQPSITMCVHYAVAFVSSCQVAGIPARCAVTTAALDGSDGHFIAEVWFPDLHKWVMVDPNVDYVVRNGDNLLSLPEVRALGSRIKDHIDFGPGTEYQRQYDHIVKFIEKFVEKNTCFKHRGLWPRADLLSNPRFSAPDHGSVNYCETDIVWETRTRDEGFGMFRYFGNEDYFNSTPQ